MNRYSKILTALTFTCSLALSHPSVNAQPSRDDIYAKVAPSTVLLKADNDTGGTKANGFFIAADVVAAPAYFAKEGMESGKNALANLIGQDQKYPVAKVLGLDENHAVAMYSVPGTSAVPLKTNAAATPKPGEVGYIIGDHICKTGTFALDTVHKGRMLLKAAISPGNSGSPILNAQGELVGISGGGLNSDGYQITPLQDIKALQSRLHY